MLSFRIWMGLAIVVVASTGCDAPAPVASRAERPVSTAAKSVGYEAEFPPRKGERPMTSDAPEGTRIAHEQQDQIPPKRLQEALLDRVRTLPGVRIDRSYVSVPGARAFHLEPELANGPREAFAARQEFGHLHPPHDGSMHLNPDPELRKRLVELGWAEPHPRSRNTVMVYGPRDEDELEIVWKVVQKCYERAAGLEIEN